MVAEYKVGGIANEKQEKFVENLLIVVDWKARRWCGGCAFKGFVKLKPPSLEASNRNMLNV